MAKEFLDTVADATVKAATAIAETAEDIFDRGKIKAAEIQTKSEIKQQFKALGELYYNCIKNKESDEQAVNACVAKIDELKVQLDDCQARLKREQQ